MICEEPANEIDLKCPEKVTDSDSESQSDVEPLLENKAFPQQRFSPVSGVGGIAVGVTGVKHVPSACRPKPIRSVNVSKTVVTLWYNQSSFYYIIFVVFVHVESHKVAWMFLLSYMALVVINQAQLTVFLIHTILQ